jgi:hypothetical protein
VHYNGRKAWVKAVSEIWASIESNIEKENNQ